MLRIENLEVETGFLENIVMEAEHGFRCCLVLAQEVEQSAHVPRGLLRDSRVPGESGRVKECVPGLSGLVRPMPDAISLGGRKG